jgi:hypothetical protein
MKFTSDIDIDFADRDELLKHIIHTPASIRTGGSVKKHNTGIYPTDIPFDPINRVSALDYNSAEDRGYIKLDLLNVWIYKLVKNEEHLIQLMGEPDWSILNNRALFEKLIHIGKHWDTKNRMPEEINSIPRLAMFLSIIRPGKKHLVGLPWSEVAKTVWIKPEDDIYYFKKAHAISYGQLVVINMNIISELGGAIP